MNELILNDQGLKDKSAWEKAGFSLPQYDRAQMIAETHKSPLWIHFGAGNIFKAFQANAAQRLLNEGIVKSGIIAVEGFDYEVCEKGYRPHDNLSILVTLKANGSIEKTVVGSIAAAYFLSAEYKPEYEILKATFANPSLQMASFTITEKGYSLVDGKGEMLPAVAADLKAGPDKPVSYIGRVTSLLYARYNNGALPIAMVSMDNCSKNGDKLHAAISAFADGWSENGLVPQGFADYINNPAKVSFPWTMIDKITPRPDASVEAILRKDGLQGLDPVVTSKGTYIAAFVNAEESEYLVIEDIFPNGRPALEKAGFIFTDRDTVNKVERMKVCTCLNPLHTALAVYGCLLGYERISDEMKDLELKKLVNVIGYEEGLPVVTDPGVINPKEFIDTVLNVRIPNPFMPDTPQRIATDTSQKLAIRFGETIKAYIESDTLDVNDLKLIPLVFAGWLRYLMAVDDSGRAFTLSDDPLLSTVCPFVKDFKFGDKLTSDEAKARLSSLLSNTSIFGVDLIETEIADLVCKYFAELISGEGAVRATLKKYATGGQK